MIKHIRVASFTLFLFVFVLCGCGKMDSQQNVTGSLAPAVQENKGGSLYEKYKNKFPANLEEMSPDEIINKLTPHIIQSSDGQTYEVYVTTDIAEEVVKDVENSYPAFDPEEYANETADNLVKELDPSLRSAIMSGDTDIASGEIDMTEDEFKDIILEKLDNKENRIKSEKSYMIFSEFAEPDVQAKIKASVADIQAAINRGEIEQYVDLMYGTRGLNYAEVRLLCRHPHYWMGTLFAGVNALKVTKGQFGNYNDNTKANSFQHSYWNVQLAQNIEGVAWWGRRDALWWAEAFSSAHEATPGNPTDSKNMDLHNNSVGRRLYDQKSSDQPLFLEVRVGRWTIIKIHYRNLAHSSPDYEFQRILADRARNAKYRFSPGVDQLVYIQ